MESGYVDDGGEDFLITIAYWIGFGVIHYLAIGNMRLIPWQHFENKD